ncbi:unnamed protein product [Amoebophrya sp. A120]|nr:unnamed protein product [Amoebophrya sp. A120]|eukprot:GSA120T00020392001.1
MHLFMSEVIQGDDEAPSTTAPVPGPHDRPARNSTTSTSTAASGNNYAAGAGAATMNSGAENSASQAPASSSSSTAATNNPDSTSLTPEQLQQNAELQQKKLFQMERRIHRERSRVIYAEDLLYFVEEQGRMQTQYWATQCDKRDASIEFLMLKLKEKENSCRTFVRIAGDARRSAGGAAGAAGNNSSTTTGALSPLHQGGASSSASTTGRLSVEELYEGQAPSTPQLRRETMNINYLKADGTVTTRNLPNAEVFSPSMKNQAGYGFALSPGRGQQGQQHAFSIPSIDSSEDLSGQNRIPGVGVPPEAAVLAEGVRVSSRRMLDHSGGSTSSSSSRAKQTKNAIAAVYNGAASSTSATGQQDQQQSTSVIPHVTRSSNSSASSNSDNDRSASWLPTEITNFVSDATSEFHSLVQEAAGLVTGDGGLTSDANKSEGGGGSLLQQIAGSYDSPDLLTNQRPGMLTNANNFQDLSEGDAIIGDGVFPTNTGSSSASVPMERTPEQLRVSPQVVAAQGELRQQHQLSPVVPLPDPGATPASAASSAGNYKSGVSSPSQVVNSPGAGSTVAPSSQNAGGAAATTTEDEGGDTSTTASTATRNQNQQLYHRVDNLLQNNDPYRDENPDHQLDGNNYSDSTTSTNLPTTAAGMQRLFQFFVDEDCEIIDMNELKCVQIRYDEMTKKLAQLQEENRQQKMCMASQQVKITGLEATVQAQEKIVQKLHVDLEQVVNNRNSSVGSGFSSPEKKEGASNKPSSEDTAGGPLQQAPPAVNQLAQSASAAATGTTTEHKSSSSAENLLTKQDSMTNTTRKFHQAYGDLRHKLDDYLYIEELEREVTTCRAQLHEHEMRVLREAKSGSGGAAGLSSGQPGEDQNQCIWKEQLGIRTTQLERLSRQLDQTHNALLSQIDENKLLVKEKNELARRLTAWR